MSRRIPPFSAEHIRSEFGEAAPKRTAQRKPRKAGAPPPQADIAPSPAIPLDINDSIVIRSMRAIGAIPLNIHVRYIDQNGANRDSSFTHDTSSSPGVIASSEISLGEVILTGISITNSGTNFDEEMIYVQAYISRGAITTFQPALVVLGGVIDNFFGISWPNKPIQSPDEYPGTFVHELINSPAAGAIFSSTISTGRRVRWDIINFTFTTDANVANRTVVLEYATAIQTVYQTRSIVLQPASTTYLYSYAPGLALSALSINTVLSPIPKVWLDDQMLLRVSASGIQAGDQFSAISAVGLHAVHAFQAP